MTDNEYTLNIRGRLMSLGQPQVMGIINVTPDSFFAGSRMLTGGDSERVIEERANRIIAEGGTMIDVGACSTRPGSEPASEREEMERLSAALPIVCRVVKERSGAETPIAVSVDTFRPDVARMACEEYGVDIINDVSEGTPEMYRMTARLGAAYILMSVEGDIESMLLRWAAEIEQLRAAGQKDIILDPGYGFGKTLEQNYRILAEQEKLLVMNLPLLVGFSRKSMIQKVLEVTADNALNGTTVLNTIGLMKGASILRVHDVKEAKETIKITTTCLNLE